MSQSTPAPKAAPAATAIITMASSGMVSTSLHARTATASLLARRSHRVRGTRCSSIATGHQQRVNMEWERKWKRVGERRTETVLTDAGSLAGRTQTGGRKSRQNEASALVYT